MSAILAAGYIRVSSEEQSEGWSLDGQEKNIRDYAESHGYEIVQIYSDEMTGSKDNRPGFERMLIDAQNGAFKAIIVVNTSRLFRNLALARRYKDMLRNKLDIELIFLSQPNVDPNDPSAFIMEGMNELFDEYYLHQLRFWTTLGKQTRARKGLWNGTIPFGYIRGEDGVPQPHPTNAKGLQMAFEAYSSGRYTDQQIADLLNREGYLTTGNWGKRLFTKDTINGVLKNTFYLGRVKYKGDEYPGLHKPLIDQELFDKCMEARAKRRSKRRAMGHLKRVYILAGIVRCHICELTLRCLATRSKNKWRYYRHMPKVRGYDCAVPGKYLRADDLESKWSEIISKIQLPQDWQYRIEKIVGDADEKAAILKERAQVQERLRRVTQLYRDLLIEEAEYQETRAQLKKQLASLIVPENRELLEAGKYLQSLAPLWEAASLEERRDITRVMVQAIYIDVNEGEILSIRPNPMFSTLLKEVCDDIGVDIIV